MSGILDLLKSDLGETIISGVSKQSGHSKDKTSSVLTMALPLLMGAMKRNTNTQSGADSLMKALSGKHDGSILNNLDGLFDGGVDENVLNDGTRIIKNVLGGSQDNVTNVLSQKTGIDTDNILNILKVAAPLVMGYLGKQTKEQNTSNDGVIGDIIGSLLGESEKQANQQNLIESLLDGNNDGSVLDDVAGMLLNSNKDKKEDLGSLLGGIFGK